MTETVFGEDWADEEVVATVTDYLEMLRAELAGEHYSKAGHRRALLARLSTGRSEAAVEYKHQNISAVMMEFGLPYIRGYRPARNYQGALAAELHRRLASDADLLGELRIGPEPRPAGRLERDAQPAVELPPPSPRVVDYEGLQAENRRLGAHGERLVVDFERAELIAAGRTDLAERVRWVAREDGDGAGFDVLSFTSTGGGRFIEVKTTALGAVTPFYLTCAEIAFAVDHADCYAIHRVYDVNHRPRFFSIEGDPTARLDLTPVVFRARPM